MDAAARRVLEQTRATLAASIEAQRVVLADLDRQLGAIDAMADFAHGPDDDPWGNAPLSDPRWIMPAEAAVLCRRSESTIIRWCEDHGIGRKFGGRWAVWKPALMEILAL
jgi:hypothetical protein